MGGQILLGILAMRLDSVESDIFFPSFLSILFLFLFLFLLE